MKFHNLLLLALTVTSSFYSAFAIDPPYGKTLSQTKREVIHLFPERGSRRAALECAGIAWQIYAVVKNVANYYGLNEQTVASYHKFQDDAYKAANEDNEDLACQHATNAYNKLPSKDPPSVAEKVEAQRRKLEAPPSMGRRLWRKVRGLVPGGPGGASGSNYYQRI